MAQSEERKVLVRWYPEDIGAIWVELDGRWFEIPAVFDRFRGVSAQAWLHAAAEIRAQNDRNAEVNRSVVRQALDFIKETNSAAMTRVGLTVEDWSEERMDYEEDRLFIGFKTSETEAQNPYDEQRNAWGTSLPMDGPSPSDASGENNQLNLTEISSGNFGTIQFPDHQSGNDADGADDSNAWTVED
jgi:putative transposase